MSEIDWTPMFLGFIGIIILAILEGWETTMKTLTPDQRMEGFIELEGVLGEGGVGGAHLMSFLAGVAHAEKVLASQEQDDEPVAIRDAYTSGLFDGKALTPRKFVRLSDEEIMECHRRTISVTRFANAMQDLLEEKNK